jgi:hypothetical protein
MTPPEPAMLREAGVPTDAQFDAAKAMLLA